MVFKDQLGNSISIFSSPKKIISLVPSQTELLFKLGLEKEIIGVTKYCIHPKKQLKNKVQIGGPKKINIEQIKELKPDLLIGNKEENERNQIEELAKEFPVWMSNIHTLDRALAMIESLGVITEKEKEATEIQNNIRKQFLHFKLKKRNLSFSNTVLYLIWRKPYMTVGSDTFINHILEICGLKNVHNLYARYPQITAEQIKKANPSFIFLSSEPYPFQEKHKAELQKICPEAKIILVDGEMFSWYGSRLLLPPSYLEGLLKNL